MKLNFKDLKQQKFTIDAETSETVAEVKQKVAAEKGFDATAIKLIWSGKILQDGNTIGSYEIKSSDHIVCMVSKPKAAPVMPSTPAPASITAQTPSAPAPAQAPAIASTASPGTIPATPSPAPASTAAATATTETPRGSNDQSSMTLGAERQAAIANMESMGFERAQIERAMRAAYYNPERAVEYLINGIPVSAAQAPQQPPQAGTTESQAQPTQTSQQPTTTSTGEADEPVNLFEAAAAANRGGQPPGRGASRGAGGPVGTVPGTAGSGGTTDEGAGNLEFMRNNATFQNLRQLVQQQPQMLEAVLQQVGNSNPQLAQLIASRPEEFMNLLMEGADGDDVPLPPGAQSVSVTEAERDAIERLCRLGFERDLVIQAYFACDKNEEMAANFLFDDQAEGADEQS